MSEQKITISLSELENLVVFLNKQSDEVKQRLKYGLSINLTQFDDSGIGLRTIADVDIFRAKIEGTYEEDITDYDLW